MQAICSDLSIGRACAGLLHRQRHDADCLIENLGRRCRAVEIAPVEGVAVAPWSGSTSTGQTPVLLES